MGNYKVGEFVFSCLLKISGAHIAEWLQQLICDEKVLYSNPGGSVWTYFMPSTPTHL